MGGFLYFIPEHITSVQQLDGWGLGYLFGRDAQGFCPCQCKGVGGVQGTVVGDERRIEETRITYRPQEQTWRKVVQAGAGNRAPGIWSEPVSPHPKPDCYVGFYNDMRPTPAELMRKDALDGHVVRLGDGNDWMIPVARGAAEEGGELRYFAKVPRRLALDESGSWGGGGIVPRYAELWTAACEFWNAFIAGKAEVNADGAAVRMEFGGVMEAAVAGLAANYRMGAAEADLLGLFDEVNCYAVCRALVDWPVIEAYLQKKTSETLPSATPAG